MDHTNSYVDRWFEESFPLVEGLSKSIPPEYRPVLVSCLVLLSVWLDILDIRGSAAIVDLATQLADSDDQIKKLNRTWHRMLKG